MEDHRPYTSTNTGAIPMGSPSDVVSGFRIMLPGLGYFGGLVKRYFLMCCLISVPLLVLGFMALRLYKPEYKSVSNSIYDNRTAMYEATNNAQREYPANSQLGASVMAYMMDDDFFVELGERLGLFKKDELSEPSVLMRLVTFVKVNLLGEPKQSPDEIVRQLKLAVAHKLQQDVSGQFNPTLFTLTIEAKGSTPGEAQKLSRMVMDLVVEKLYMMELDRIQRSIADLESYFRTEASNLSKEGDAGAAVVPTARGIANQASIELSEPEKNRLVIEAQRLNKKLQEAKEAYQQIYKAKMEQKLSLEAELNRMQTHMKPNHPLVMAKADELTHVLDGQEIVVSKQQVDDLATHFRRIQLRLQSAGILIGDNSVLDGTRDSSSYYAALGTRIQQLRAEKISLRNQLETPGVRTRFRLVEDASFPTKTSNSKKKLLLIAAVPGLSLFIAILAIIFCELFSAYPRDTWKIVNALQLPLLGEMRLSRIRKVRNFNLDTILEMKQALAANGRHNLRMSDAYVAYREWNTQLKQIAAGKVILLQPLGAMRLPLPFLQNLLNVFAADFSQKVLLIDFNRKEPGIPASIKGRDIYSLIEHKTRLEEILVHRDDKVLFDRIAVRDDLPPTAIRAEFLKRLFELLLKKYNTIFLYGLDSGHFLENNLIAQTVTDCFAIVRAREISYNAISLARKNLVKDRLHGFFLIR